MHYLLKISENSRLMSMSESSGIYAQEAGKMKEKVWGPRYILLLHSYQVLVLHCWRFEDTRILFSTDRSCFYCGDCSAIAFSAHQLSSAIVNTAQKLSSALANPAQCLDSLLHNQLINLPIPQPAHLLVNLNGTVARDFRPLVFFKN